MNGIFKVLQSRLGPQPFTIYEGRSHNLWPRLGMQTPAKVVSGDHAIDNWSGGLLFSYIVIYSVSIKIRGRWPPRSSYSYIEVYLAPYTLMHCVVQGLVV